VEDFMTGTDARGALRALVTFAVMTVLVWTQAALAADATQRCTREIIGDGTGLLIRELAVSSRCAEQGFLREQTENCPDWEKIDALVEAGLHDSERACHTPLGGNDVCMQRAGEFGFDLAVSAYASLPTDPEPEKRLRRCRVVVGRAVNKAAFARAEDLRRCIGKAVLGKPGFGPADETCDGPGAKFSARRAKVAMAQQRKILAACVGLDPRNELGFPEQCGSAPCDFPVTTASDLATCATCLAVDLTGQGVADLAKLPLSQDAACRLVFARNLAAFASTAIRSLARCRNDRLAQPGEPCPEADTDKDVTNARNTAKRRVVAACIQGEASIATFSCPGACQGITVSDAATLDQCLQCATDEIAQQTARMVDVTFPSAAPTSAAALHCARQIGSVTTRLSSGLGPTVVSILRGCDTDRRCTRDAAACTDATLERRIARKVVTTARSIRRRCGADVFSALSFGATCPLTPRDVPGSTCEAIATTDLGGLIDCFACAVPAMGRTIAATSFPP
jgi:hypothetical protein